VGDPGASVGAVAPLVRAGPQDLTFCDTPKYASLFASSQAGLALVTPQLAEMPGPAARIVVDRPRDALLAVLPCLYRSPARVPGIDPTARIGRSVTLPGDATVEAYAVIGDGARVGERAWIGAHAVVGAGVVLGDDVRLHPGVTLYSGTRVGHRVTVHAGTRLGSDGFGYVFRDGAHEKIPHVGRCIVEDDVEIGANTTIDRGSIDDTVIGAGTKIDNLVHIAHNVRIGRLCLLMAQVGIAGSARLEDGCILAGQVGMAGHRTVGAGARVGGQGGVFGDIPPGETWSGYPARPHKEALRAHAAMFKLPQLIRTLEQMVRERQDAADTEARGRSDAEEHGTGGGTA